MPIPVVQGSCRPISKGVQLFQKLPKCSRCKSPLPQSDSLSQSDVLGFRYRPRKSEVSQACDKEKFIPAGVPYLTKVNGKLALARQKTPKAADIAIDLLGEAFGRRATILRRKSKSLEPLNSPPLIAGSTYIPQPQLTYSAPIPQQAFPQPSPTIPMIQYQYRHSNPHMYSPNIIPTTQYPTQYPPRCHELEPQRYTFRPSKPSEKDIEELRHIDAHFNEINTEKPMRLSTGQSPGKIDQEDSTIKTKKNVLEDSVTKTAATITKHVCANCGRLRSRKYYHEHPIKVGEIPDLAFCRKCQKDAGSTSGSDENLGLKNKEKKEVKSKDTIKNEGLEPKNAPARSPNSKEVCMIQSHQLND